jgi:hypothetical protein
VCGTLSVSIASPCGGCPRKDLADQDFDAQPLIAAVEIIPVVRLEQADERNTVRGARRRSTDYLGVKRM